MPHAFRSAFVLALLTTLCGCSHGVYRVPLGAMISLPSGAGRSCRPGWWSRGSIEFTQEADSTTFLAKKLGSATVRCSERTLDFEVEELTRLELTGPDTVEVGSLLDPEYRLLAYGSSGQELELWMLAHPDITWNTPESFHLRQPRCGHMMAVCSGFIGNGEIMTADPESPGAVVLAVTMRGMTVSRTITVKPKAP